MGSLNRRKFLKSSIGAAAALTVLGQRKSFAANDKINIGIMGVGGRGCALLRSLARRSDVNIAYICDVDTTKYAKAANIVEEGVGYKPKFVQDFRKMLDDKSLNAMVNATSDRWHALGSIMACQAGKDVYVEKPLSLSIWDGRKMVEAARKYKRVVQVGMQSRNAPYIDKAAEYIRSGKLGEVFLVRVFLMQRNGPIRVADVKPVPESMDYELWCGPSPKMPYRPGRWFWRYWDFYTGWINADMIHQMDLARYVVGKTYPDTVCHAGGVYQFDDGREQPDTTFATYEFDKLTMLAEAALQAPYMHRIVQLRGEWDFPDWPFSATKIEICGTEAFMYIGRHGGGFQVYKKKEKMLESEAVFSEPGYPKFGGIVDLHFDDFFSCMHSRKKPKADVEEGHISMALCHMASISYRVGNRKLKFDGKTESFTSDPEANKYLKAKYRKPWVVPEVV